MSTLKFRELKEADLVYIKRWGPGFQNIVVTSGYVIVNKYEIPLLIGYLFPTEAKFGFIESFIANPSISKELRRNSIKSMIYSLLTRAKTLGLKMVVASPTVDSLTRQFLDKGFNLYPRKADYVWKEI